jgi:hypothetical protein
MKACKDCKFFNSDWGYSCSQPDMMKPDVIHGATHSDPRTNRDIEALCGRDAKHFQQKDRIIMRWFAGPITARGGNAP